MTGAKQLLGDQPPTQPTRGRSARTRLIAAKATPGHAKQHNRTLVLQMLHQSGPLSRADVARATGLTKVTVSGLVAELITEGILHELGQQESQRPGKPAILIDLARESHAVIALDLSDHRLMRGAVMNLDGTVVARAELPRVNDTGDGDTSGSTDKGTGEIATGDAALELVIQVAESLRDATKLHLLGLGVGTPGVVDDDGTVRTAPNLGWENLHLRRILEDRIGLPTVVANDANVAALAEYSFGETSSDFILIAIGHGVGAGLIIDGHPIVGNRFASGEIGQVMVGTDLGLDAPYSREYVLEHWLSAPALTRSLAAASAADRSKILHEAGSRLGVVLAPIIGLLNLAEVVLAGPEELIDGTLADATLEILRRRTMPDSHTDLVLRTSTQGDDLILRGATAIVLKQRLGIS